MRGKTMEHKTVMALFYPAALNQVFRKRKGKIEDSNSLLLISFQVFNTGLKGLPTISRRVQFVPRTEGASGFHVSHHSSNNYNVPNF